MAGQYKSLYDSLRKGLNSPERTRASQKWFADKVKSIGKIQGMRMLKDPHFVAKTQFRPGFMYHFLYEAKHKETLPYFDKFPLMIAVAPAEGGFYGLNLHYLHPTIRARFLDKLMETTNNEKYDETTKFKINYRILTSLTGMKPFAPCFKHYLFEQVQSRIMMVPSSEWEISIFLPTENFVGAKKQTVWTDSKKTIRGYNR